MSLYRVLFSLLIISSLLAGPAIGLEPKAKKDSEQAEKKDKQKKDAHNHDSKEHDKKKHDEKKDDKDHGEKGKKKPSKDDVKGKDEKKGDQAKKDAPQKETKPEPKKPEAKKEEPKKVEPKKDESKKAEPKKEEKPAKEAPKKEMKPEPKKEEPTPAKRPTPEPKVEVEQPKKMESKLEPKKEEKPEEIPPPKEDPKPEPKPTPQPQPQPKPNPQKFAVTDLSQVDEDFAFQGEYYGKLRLPGGILENTGIQVIARGDGNFVGRQLRGGLPGNGWRNDQMIDLSGKREGNSLKLSQGGYQVVITGTKAIVTNSAGDTLGILLKVHRRSELLGLKPSSGATVLFDGTSADGFIDAKINDKGELQIGTITKDPVQDFRMHLEFRLPYMPYATGQARSNSGLYIQERYEVQILDSFGLPGEFNECGALYRTKSPDINMCFPPLTWQTYDVYFTAARFDAEGNKTSPARITVQHNGILVQDNYVIPNKTGAGKPEGAEAGRIKLQDHGNPVVFRNVWIQHLGGPVVTSQTEAIDTPEKN